MIDFWGVGFDVAERMNLLPRLLEVGYLIDRVRFVDERSRVRSEIDGDAVRRAVSDRFVSLPRGDLARAIFDRIVNDVEIIFDDSVMSLHEEPSGIELQFEHSAPRRFDLVVGCDGLHSAVRQAVFGPENQFEKYLGYYAASFVTREYPHRDERAYVSYAAPGRQISRYWLRGDRTAFLFVFAREERFIHHPHQLDARAILRETFASDRWSEIPEILNRLKDCEDLYFDSVSQIRMPAWSLGRIVLVGDAAYCPSLLAGEGAGLAMAGAYILAGELQRWNGDYSRAFRSYEQQLRAFIERKQHSGERFANSFAPKTRFGLFIRDLVLRSVPFSFVSDWLMQSFVADRFELPDYPNVGHGNHSE